jgi:hypothetical protein
VGENGLDLFIEITLSKSRVLYLSGGHFIPTASDPSQPLSKAVMKRAQDVVFGEWVWATHGNDTEGVKGKREPGREKLSGWVDGPLFDVFVAFQAPIYFNVL